MRAFRRKRADKKNGTSHRRPLRDDETMRSASLGSPIFVESWNGGSPLNWLEFMGRWETKRADRKSSETDT